MQKGQYFISIIILLNAFDFTIKTGVWPLLTTMLNIECFAFGQFVPSVPKQSEHAPGALPHYDQRRQRDSRSSGYFWNNQLARK